MVSKSTARVVEALIEHQEELLTLADLKAHLPSLGADSISRSLDTLEREGLLNIQWDRYCIDRIRLQYLNINDIQADINESKTLTRSSNTSGIEDGIRS